MALGDGSDVYGPFRLPVDVGVESHSGSDDGAVAAGTR